MNPLTSLCYEDARAAAVAELEAMAASADEEEQCENCGSPDSGCPCSITTGSPEKADRGATMEEEEECSADMDDSEMRKLLNGTMTSFFPIRRHRIDNGAAAEPLSVSPHQLTPPPSVLSSSASASGTNASWTPTKWVPDSPESPPPAAELPPVPPNGREDSVIVISDDEESVIVISSDEEDDTGLVCRPLTSRKIKITSRRLRLSCPAEETLPEDGTSLSSAPTRKRQRRQTPLANHPAPADDAARKRQKVEGGDSRLAPAVPPPQAQPAVKPSDETFHFPCAAFNRKYQVLAPIGKGGGGTVYSGFRRSDNAPVAVKQIRMRSVKRWAHLEGRVVPIEFSLYKQAAVDNPYVVQMLDWYEHSKEYVLVMDRHPDMIDLFDFTNNVRGRITEHEAHLIFSQVREAVLKCHRNGVVHRDIKDENVLVDPRTLETKIIDFGCAAKLKSANYTEFAGTPEFYPPEWFIRRSYSGLSLDSWSLGVLLYAMLEGEVPYKPPFNKPSPALHFRAPLRFKEEPERRESDLCRDFIRRLLSKKICERINLHTMVDHHWMRMRYSLSSSS